MNWEPRKLEEVMREVKEIEIRKKIRIDPKIKPLVIGLRRWGINTEMSCQGHPNRFPFPWILINPEDIDKLLAICGWYNVKKKPFFETIKWVILPMTLPSGEISIRLLPRGLFKENISLEKLQESAIEFGKLLQELQELPMNLKERPEQVLKLLPLFAPKVVIAQK